MPITPTTIRRRATAAATAVIVAGLLGGCGATTKPVTAPRATTAPTSTTSPATPLPPTTAATTATTAPGAPTTPAPAVTTAAPTSACAPSALTVALLGHDGAGGTAYYVFNVTNRSASDCQIGGYFGAAIYTPAGHLLSGSPVRDATTSQTGSGPVPITLASGAVAHVVIDIGETPIGGATTCPQIGAFHLTPPNSYSSIQVSTGDDHTDIDCGTFRIQPTAAGPATP